MWILLGSLKSKIADSRSETWTTRRGFVCRYAASWSALACFSRSCLPIEICSSSMQLFDRLAQQHRKSTSLNLFFLKKLKCILTNLCGYVLRKWRCACRRCCHHRFGRFFGLLFFHLDAHRSLFVGRIWTNSSGN